MPVRECPYEQIALPGRKPIAPINREPRRRDRGRPIDDWLLESWALGVRRHVGSGVVHAVGDDWPTIVPAGDNDVQFIAPTRTVFGLVEAAARCIENQALWVAMAPGVDLRPDGASPDERVV